MKLAACSALCDAIEIGALQLRQSLTPDDILREALQNSNDEESRNLVAEAFSVAVQRSTMCPNGYPFDVSDRMIQARPAAAGFNAYLFLLLGCLVKNGGVANPEEITRRFRKYFEDLVCWSLRRPYFLAEVLSEPRSERGLHTSLKPALRTIANRWGEQARLQNEMVTEDDNDLGVDVLATNTIPDNARSGKPIFLIQCATGTLNNLEAKMTEKSNVFPGVWKKGFYAASSIRCGATPDDLLNLQPVFWDRLCKSGWVLDRMRLVRMANFEPIALPMSQGLLQLWNDLFASIPISDWRTTWQDSW